MEQQPINASDKMEEIKEENNEENKEIIKEEVKEEEKKVEHRNNPPFLKIYPIENYQIEKRDKLAKIKHQSFEYKMEQLKISVEKNHVPRTSVYGVILVHKNNFPHLLLLQSNISTSLKEDVQLVGGRLKTREDDPVEGLKRKMRKKLSLDTLFHYEVGELLGTFYRTNYDQYLYPYLPVHINQAKEIIHLYVVHLTERCDFRIFQTDKLNSIPLFSLHNNFDNYNTILCSIPTLVSRYLIING